MSNGFPPAFAHLEKYAAWALPKESQRLHKKCNASMTEIQELYDALASSIDAIMEHLNAIAFEKIDGADKNLMDLACCFTTLETSVSGWGKPDLPDIFPIARWEFVQERF